MFGAMTTGTSKSGAGGAGFAKGVCSPSSEGSAPRRLRNLFEDSVWSIGSRSHGVCDPENPGGVVDMTQGYGVGVVEVELSVATMQWTTVQPPLGSAGRAGHTLGKYGNK